MDSECARGRREEAANFLRSPPLSQLALRGHVLLAHILPHNTAYSQAMPGLNDTSAADMPPPVLPVKRGYANGPGGLLAAASTSTVAGQTPEARKAKADSLRIPRQSLPIWSGKEAIVDAVQNNETVILLAETGSGKTTRELCLRVRDKRGG